MNDCPRQNPAYRLTHLIRILVCPGLHSDTAGMYNMWVNKIIIGNPAIPLGISNNNTLQHFFPEIRLQQRIFAKKSKNNSYKRKT